MYFLFHKKNLKYSYYLTKKEFNTIKDLMGFFQQDHYTFSLIYTQSPQLVQTKLELTLIFFYKWICVLD